MSRPGRRGLSRNERLSRIGYRDEGGDWYGLDNAATIMPSMSDAVSTYLFRLSADLYEAVHLPSLQAALERTARRFPYFCVELRRGFFWHYLEPHGATPKVQTDEESPCQGFDMHARNVLLFRVRARDRTIACEFSHVLTDGTGGIRFLKNLLVEYFRVRDADAGSRAEAPSAPSPAASAPGSAAEAPPSAQTERKDPDLYDLDQAPEPEEHEDAYNRYFPEKYPHPAPERPAFRIRSSLLAPGRYRVISGAVPLAPALQAAKRLGASLTELLTAAYLEALQEIWLASPQRRRRARSRLAIEVPVNMRKFLETKSNRNFSLFVHVEQDMRLGSRSFEDILSRVHHFLRYEVDGPSMARHIARNVTGGRLFLIRVIPLALKTPLMRFLYAFYGENIVSGVMSNLGPVSLPEAIAGRIRRFDFIPAPSVALKVKASVLSWGDYLYVNFGSLAVSRELERLFFTRLRRLGLPVRVECNLEE